MAESGQNGRTEPGAPLPLKACSIFEVVMVKSGGQKFHVHKSILSKYAMKFKRALEADYTHNENGLKIVYGPHEYTNNEIFASYLDLTYRHHFSGGHDPINSVDNGDNSLELLSTLAQVHQLCDRLESPIIGSWVTREFTRSINTISPRWGTATEQEESRKWLEKAFLDWGDADCKHMVVTKFNKTIPDNIYTNLVPSLHHDFLTQVAIYRPKMIIEQYELKHKQTPLFGPTPWVLTKFGTERFPTPKPLFDKPTTTQDLPFGSFGTTKITGSSTSGNMMDAQTEKDGSAMEEIPHTWTPFAAATKES